VKNFALSLTQHILKLLEDQLLGEISERRGSRAAHSKKISILQIQLTSFNVVFPLWELKDIFPGGL